MITALTSGVLQGHAAGEERYIKSDKVTAHIQSVLGDCDLIVGTEEEVHIAGGTEDTLAALKAIRAISKGTIVLKRGPMGCVVYPGEIPASLEDGIIGKGFPIEVYNVLGAGDGFMSGFLRGWLKVNPSRPVRHGPMPAGPLRCHGCSARRNI